MRYQPPSGSVFENDDKQLHSRRVRKSKESSLVSDGNVAPDYITSVKHNAAVDTRKIFAQNTENSVSQCSQINLVMSVMLFS
jgi:hypothetical protein